MTHSLARCVLIALVAACGGKPTEPAAPAEEPGVATAPAEEPVAAAPSECDAADPSTWAACEGQSLTVTGAIPEVEYQHPVMAGPDQVQSVVVVGGSQVLVITGERPSCTGAVEATGTVTPIDLGGEEGTRKSYQGWMLQGAEVRCP